MDANVKILTISHLTINSYVDAIYFNVMNCTGVGYGDIHSRNDREKTFTIFL
jgi:hypothetical protein